MTNDVKTTSTIQFAGKVTDFGNGTVTMRIDRDTIAYPAVGTEVTVSYTAPMTPEQAMLEIAEIMKNHDPKVDVDARNAVEAVQWTVDQWREAKGSAPATRI